MTKVKLCFTTNNADTDWLVKEVNMDEINYEGVIDDYIREFKPQSKQLDDKFGDDDHLFLNFRMGRTNPILFRLIDEYMESI
jgi:hypothetical protein